MKERIRVSEKKNKERKEGGREGGREGGHLDFGPLNQITSGHIKKLIA